jgi:hypothetical protein
MTAGVPPISRQQHPNNVWSLRGYHQCLTLLGRTEEGSAVKAQLDRALGIADVPIHASCFCAWAWVNSAGQPDLGTRRDGASGSPSA